MFGNWKINKSLFFGVSNPNSELAMHVCVCLQTEVFTKQQRLIMTQPIKYLYTSNKQNPIVRYYTVVYF